MQKKREHVVVTEKVQVGCKWQLKDFFHHRHCHPKKKLLLTKNQNRDVTGAGHPRVKSSASTLGNNCQGIKSAPENKGVGIAGEINVPKLIQENDEMHKFALEILDSNNELFLKLLKDPNSLLVKRVRNAKNLQQAKKETVKLLYENKLAECGNNAIPRKSQNPTPSTHKLLLKRIKSQYGCPSADDEIPSTSNSIVVLKPRLTKHERDVLRKHINLELSNRAAVSQKLNLPTVSSFNQRDIEAKMHLSKMLRNAENAEHFSDIQGPRTLKSILSSPLSSPEHECSAAFSQEKDADASASACPRKMIYSACSNNEFSWDEHSSPLQYFEVATSASFMKLTDESHTVESREETIEPVYSSDGLSCEAYVNNMELNDMIISEDLDISKLACAEQSTGTTKVSRENRFSKCSIQDLRLEDKPLNSSSPNPFSKYKVEINDGSNEREEHLSPNSVLKAFFTKDFTDLSSNISCPAKSHTRPHGTDCKEALLVEDHLRTVLQTTGSYWEELSKKSHSSVELLNTSSLAEHKLFLDFIKDILLEINQSHFDFYPRASPLRQNTLASSILAKNMMEDFLEEIRWYLVPPVMPRTLDDLAIKDIKNDENWSGRKLETEEVVIQLTDDLLVELIMQTTCIS